MPKKKRENKRILERRLALVGKIERENSGKLSRIYQKTERTVTKKKNDEIRKNRSNQNY